MSRLRSTLRVPGLWMMDNAPVPLLDFLASIGVIPGHHAKQTPRFVAKYAQFAETEHASREVLEKMQNQKLHELAVHAYKRIPYYNRQWQELGITPDEIRRPADLAKLPLMTREDVLTHAADLIDPSLDKAQLEATPTGGTTGAAVRVYRDIEGSASRQAFYYRWTTRAGCDFQNDRYAMISRPSFDLMADPRRWGSRGERFHGSYAPGSRALTLACTNLLPEVLTAYSRRMKRAKVVYLKGYPSAVHQLAQYLVNRGETLPLKAVLTSSECLFDDTREIVRKGFLCEVWDHYSCNELSVSASECERHSGYHVDTERCVVEVVDSAGVQLWDEVGLVCGTDLDNRAMPLFRYCLNDEAEMTRTPCECGRGHVMIKRLIGRRDDYVLTPTGVRITAPTLRQTLNDLDAVREFQITQETAHRVRVRIVANEDWRDSALETARSRLDGFLNGSMDIEVERVDLIERAASGKFRLIVNDHLARSGQPAV